MESSARQLLPAIRETNAGQPAISRRPAPLWLAVHFPWLAGEVLSGGGPAMAVSEETRRGWLVYRASPEALRRGVCPGMTISAASVIYPGLAARRRRPRRERRRLEELGDWMLSYSPVVSVQPPETVLLEVRGSLNLFGGVERLETLITRRLSAAGHIHHIAGAPTPAAAKTLAHWGRDGIVEEKSALRSALGAMPVVLLNIDRKTAKRLQQAGIRVLRDLWRLPADGLARRFGAGLVRELDRLQGRRPDPQPLHESRPRFSASLMLDWATDDLAHINRGVEHLLRQWADYLRRSERGTSGFTIECLPEMVENRGSRVTRVDIGLRRVSRDMDHLYKLAVERLDRVRFIAPVAELRLKSDRIHLFPGRSGQLFETGEETAVQWQQNEELLKIHLGGRGLETLHAVAEHRPEYAWHTETTAPPGGDMPGRHRPLWLLRDPSPLPWVGEASGHEIIMGPERIETGWWDRRDQRRDYYVAVDSRGRRLWVFQDLRHRQWYLHGLFG